MLPQFSNAYGAAGTPNTPQKLYQEGPANAIQAIAAGVEAAAPQPGRGNRRLSGIVEEGESDDYEDVPPPTRNNPPPNNGPGNNTTANDTTGSTTGNSTTFGGPKTAAHDATIIIKKQSTGRNPQPQPVLAARRADPPRWTWASLLKVLTSFFLLYLAFSEVGPPFGMGQYLGQRLRSGKPFDVGRRFHTGSAPTKTPSTHEYGLLLQRVNSLERRLDATPLAEAAPQMRRINYFAIGAGAIIEPMMTSPTKTTRRPFVQKVRAWFWGLSYPEGFGPTAALSPWDDMGDCWCAPPSDNPWAGRAQLGVLLPRKIFPTELVIEHIPAGATFDIHSAPKEIELWAKIEDDAAREAVGNAVFPLLPDDSTAVNPNDFSQKLADPMRSLDHTFVRIGKWKYDIHSSANNIQTFHVPVDLKYFNAVVNKVAVRSLNNWGLSSYTCFYRLKLHGDLAVPEEALQPDKHLPKKGWVDHVADWLVLQLWDWL